MSYAILGYEIKSDVVAECRKKICSYYLCVVTIKITGLPKRKDLLHGTPKGTRTPDLLVRSQSLYPTELSAHTAFLKRLDMIAHSFPKCKYFSQKI